MIKAEFNAAYWLTLFATVLWFSIPNGKYIHKFMKTWEHETGLAGKLFEISGISLYANFIYYKNIINRIIKRKIILNVFKNVSKSKFWLKIYIIYKQFLLTNLYSNYM